MGSFLKVGMCPVILQCLSNTDVRFPALSLYVNCLEALPSLQSVLACLRDGPHSLINH